MPNAHLVLFLILALSSGAIGREMWFGSTPAVDDMVNLFLNPEQWPQARSLISAYVFYEQGLTANCAYDACGPNNLTLWQQTGALKALADLDLSVAVEAGVIKDWSCNGQSAYDFTVTALNGLLQVGGPHAGYLNMDEPLYSSTQSPCTMPMDSAVTYVSQYISNVLNTFPDLKIGDIEPYPALDPQTHIAWIRMLKASAPQLTHYHLDIDWNGVRNKRIKNPANDIAKIREAVASSGLIFGIIINGAGYPSPKTNQAYFTNAMNWIDTYLTKGSLSPSDRVIWQSWETLTPSNLPESTPWTHTNLIVTGTQKIGH